MNQPLNLPPEPPISSDDTQPSGVRVKERREGTGLGPFAAVGVIAVIIGLIIAMQNKGEAILPQVLKDLLDGKQVNPALIQEAQVNEFLISQRLPVFIGRMAPNQSSTYTANKGVYRHNNNIVPRPTKAELMEYMRSMDSVLFMDNIMLNEPMPLGGYLTDILNRLLREEGITDFAFFETDTFNIGVTTQVYSRQLEGKLNYTVTTDVNLYDSVSGDQVSLKFDVVADSNQDGSDYRETPTAAIYIGNSSPNSRPIMQFVISPTEAVALSRMVIGRMPVGTHSYILTVISNQFSQLIVRQNDGVEG